MAQGEIYLVRHGRYDEEDLNWHGREVDAVSARDDLLTRGLDEETIVLSSSAPRAVQTAEIIADGLGTDFAQSELIKRGGKFTMGIENLDEFLGRALAEAGVERPEESPLVVVAHAPMIAIARYDYRPDGADKIAYGGVYEYTPGTWMNPRYIKRYQI